MKDHHDEAEEKDIDHIGHFSWSLSTVFVDNENYPG